jgi:hypothetical protein
LRRIPASIGLLGKAVKKKQNYNGDNLSAFQWVLPDTQSDLFCKVCTLAKLISPTTTGYENRTASNPRNLGAALSRECFPRDTAIPNRSNTTPLVVAADIGRR